MIREDDDLHTGHEHAAEHHGEVSSPPPRIAEEKALTPEQPRKKARRGFAAMSPEKQREIASLGGKAAHAKGTAHEFSPEEAREAGRKGGQAAQRARQTTKSPDEPEPTKH
jgi:general stress protein YciG